MLRYAPASTLSILLVPEAVTGLSQKIGEHLRIYPVPASEILYVESGIEIYHVKISNLLGQVIFSNKYNTPLAEIETGRFSKGIYLISLTDNNGKGITRRIVIDR